MAASPATKNPVGAIATAGVAVIGGAVWLHEVSKDVHVYVPTLDDVVTDNDVNDPYVILYRGVYAGHPGYVPALGGMAVPGGDVLDPTAHNNGNPSDIANSGFTAWSEFPSVAFQMATRTNPKLGVSTGGVILAKAFKMSYLMSLMSNPATASPDKFRQGEILIPGVVTGAVPVPVPPTPK